MTHRSRARPLFCAFAVSFTLCNVSSAFAGTPDASTVIVPVGAWIAGILAWLQPIALTAAGAAIAYIAARAGGPLAALLIDKSTDALLERAIDYAFGAVIGAEKGKVFSIAAGNDVLAAAERFAVANAPFLAKRLGERLRAALFARLAATGGVPAAASAENYSAVVKVPQGR